MKRILSVLLSLALCISVLVTSPPIVIGENILTPTQSEQPEDGDWLSPCDDSYLPGAGESNG